MPITPLLRPCWEATCDGCGEGDNTDFGNCFHHASLKDTIDDLTSSGWQLVHRRSGVIAAVYCETCWAGLSDQRRNEIALIAQGAR